MKVDNLFLPQLSNGVVLESFLYNICYCENYQQSNELIETFAKLKSESNYGKTTIIQVLPYEKNGKESNYNDIQGRFNNAILEKRITSFNDNYNKVKISVGTLLPFSDWEYIPFNPIVSSKESVFEANTVTDWVYIPFNPIVPSKFDTLLNDPYFNEIVIDGTIDYSRLMQKVQNDGVERIKKIYVNHFGNNHNSYSMALFSGLPNGNAYTSFILDRYLWEKNHSSREPNCLYTGDFELDDFLDLSNFYKNIGVKYRWIQVPHHGSRKNWNEALYGKNVCFMSVGVDDKYKHPNIDVLINLKKVNCYPIVITEDLNTMIVANHEIDGK